MRGVFQESLLTDLYHDSSKDSLTLCKFYIRIYLIKWLKKVRLTTSTITLRFNGYLQAGIPKSTAD